MTLRGENNFAEVFINPPPPPHESVEPLLDDAVAEVVFFLKFLDQMIMSAL